MLAQGATLQGTRSVSGACVTGRCETHATSAAISLATSRRGVDRRRRRSYRLLCSLTLAPLLCAYRMLLAVSTGQLAVKGHAQRRAVRRCPAASLSAADGSIVEPKTKVAFPQVLLSQRCLGAGVRAKQLLGPIAVSVYAVALFADVACAKKALVAAAAAAEDETATLLSSSVPLTLCLTFVRTVTSAQFLGALNEELATRTTDKATLEAFGDLFRGRALDTGATVLLSLQPASGLDVSLLSPQTTVPPVTPDASFPSPAFAQALFDVYLGQRSIVPEAKAAWAAGARKL